MVINHTTDLNTTKQGPIVRRMFKSTIMHVVVLLILHTPAINAAVIGHGIGYSAKCADAIPLSIESAAESASNFIPKEISSYTEIRNSMLFRDEIASKQNYYLLSYVADSIKNDFGCKVTVEAKFDSSKLAPIVTKLNGWSELPYATGPISKEIINSRKLAERNSYEFLAKYVQREFRSAIDVSITRVYSMEGDDQIESSTFKIKSNNQFETFVKNTQILINEIQDKFDFSPIVKIDFQYDNENNKGRFSRSYFEIENSRYMERNMPISENDFALRSGYSFEASTKRIIHEPFVLDPIKYTITVYPNWNYRSHSKVFESEYSNHNCVEDSANELCRNVAWENRKTRRVDLEPQWVSKYGVDYDFSHKYDTMCWLSKKEKKVYCKSYAEFYEGWPMAGWPVDDKNTPWLLPEWVERMGHLTPKPKRNAH